jgi:hypothetical protein
MWAQTDWDRMSVIGIFSHVRPAAGAAGYAAQAGVTAKAGLRCSIVLNPISFAILFALGKPVVVRTYPTRPPVPFDVDIGRPARESE